MNDGPVVACACPEIRNGYGQLVHGLTPESLQRTHDCDYVRRRSALVPWAERIADREVGLVREDEGPWIIAFMAAMTQLAMRLGAIGQVKLDYAECNVRSSEGYFCTLSADHPQGYTASKHEAWGDVRRVHAWKAE